LLFALHSVAYLVLLFHIAIAPRAPPRAAARCCNTIWTHGAPQQASARVVTWHPVLSPFTRESQSLQSIFAGPGRRETELPHRAFSLQDHKDTRKVKEETSQYFCA